MSSAGPTARGARPVLTTVCDPSSPYDFISNRNLYRLVHVISQILPDVPMTDITNIRNDSTYRALLRKGVNTFEKLLDLTDEDILSLVAPAQAPVGAGPTSVELHEFRDEIDIPTHAKRQLIAVKHFFHDICYNAKKQVEMSTIPKARFGIWRASECAHGSALIPYSKRIKDEKEKRLEKAKSIWDKSIRISKSEYPQLKDSRACTTFSERFLTTAQSHNLAHVIDSSYIPDPGTEDVYESQKKWMFSVLEDAFQTHATRRIAKAHQDSKDVPKIWDEIEELMKKSMVSLLSEQDILTFLNSDKMHTTQFKGTQQGYLAHWLEQFRQLQVRTGTTHNEHQACLWLNNAVAGVDNLQSACFTMLTARQAAGRPGPALGRGKARLARAAQRRLNWSARTCMVSDLVYTP